MSHESRDTGASVLWVLPRLSQEFQEGPIVNIAGDKATLRYDYESSTGMYEWEEATFSGVVGVIFTAHESCTEEQIAAFDKLVEVPGSEWLASLQSARAAAGFKLAAGVRHMRIYFDEVGCLEVAAARFDAPLELG